MCEPTLLDEGVRDLAGRGALRIVEISPHPVALYSVQQTLTALAGTRSAVLAASHRDLAPTPRPGGPRGPAVVRRLRR
ncbi:hypothetical protein ACFQ7M_38425 [Streptomyces massasporeus]